MRYSEERLWSLLRQAEELPFGANRTALVEQVIAEADTGRYPELAFQARLSGTTCYIYGGEPAKSVDTFTWCLAEFDRDPDGYADSRLSLMWQFKSTVTALLAVPDTPLSRVDDVLADMERRWAAGGHSPHAVYSLRHVVARHVGDEAAAQSWYDRWLTSPRDQLSDCAACNPGRRVRWLTRHGRYDEAVQVAEPVLDGRVTCSEQPQGILTDLLEPYLRSGALDDARDAHRRAYRRLRGSVAAMFEVGDHVWFCAVTGNTARGLEIVERHLPWLDVAPSPLAELRFASRAALLLGRTPGGHRLHRPGHGARTAAPVTAAALGAELATRTLELAGRFDARNGSGYQTAPDRAAGRGPGRRPRPVAGPGRGALPAGRVRHRVRALARLRRPVRGGRVDGTATRPARRRVRPGDGQLRRPGACRDGLALRHRPVRRGGRRAAPADRARPARPRLLRQRPGRGRPAAGRGGHHLRPCARRAGPADRRVHVAVRRLRRGRPARRGPGHAGPGRGVRAAQPGSERVDPAESRPRAAPRRGRPGRAVPGDGGRGGAAGEGGRVPGGAGAGGLDPRPRGRGAAGPAGRRGGLRRGAGGGRRHPVRATDPPAAGRVAGRFRPGGRRDPGPGGDGGRRHGCRGPGRRQRRPAPARHRVPQRGAGPRRRRDGRGGGRRVRRRGGSARACGTAPARDRRRAARATGRRDRRTGDRRGALPVHGEPRRRRADGRGDRGHPRPARPGRRGGRAVRHRRPAVPAGRAADRCGTRAAQARQRAALVA